MSALISSSLTGATEYFLTDRCRRNGAKSGKSKAGKYPYLSPQASLNVSLKLTSLDYERSSAAPAGLHFQSPLRSRLCLVHLARFLIKLDDLVPSLPDVVMPRTEKSLSRKRPWIDDRAHRAFDRVFEQGCEFRIVTLSFGRWNDFKIRGIEDRSRRIVRSAEGRSGHLDRSRNVPEFREYAS